MTDFLSLSFVFLIAGVIAVPIASRLGLGSVLGYLLAGIAISPILAAGNVDVVSIQHFAEFGVVMMLFLVGLELEPKMLWQMRHRLLGLGGLQVLLTILLVMGAAMVMGQAWSVALAIGMVLALSSTAIVLQTLNEKGMLKSDGGQSSFSVLLFQDIAVIPMLALIPLLAMPDLMAVSASAEDHHTSFTLTAGLNGWQTTLVTLAAVASVVLVGHFLTRPIFTFIAMAGLRELFTAVALLFVVSIALIMNLVGLSPALGTFIAGVVLANSEYRHELESDIAPFRGLLLGLFFMTVGAGINFALLQDNFITIMALTLGLILLKCMVLWVLAWQFKLQGANRWLFALGLAQAGEFGFVLLSFTVSNAVLPIAITEQLFLIVALSMLLTPALFIFYERVLLPRFTLASEKTADDIESEGNIIIAGHGRFGGVINQMLLSAGFKTTVLDYSAEQLKLIRSFGGRVFYGDASRPDLLHAAGIESAKVLVIAIDNEEVALHIVRHVSLHHPHVHIIARALNRHHVYDLYAAGCRDIIRDTFDSAVRTGRSAFEALGIDKQQAETLAQRYTVTDKRYLAELAALYDADIPVQENAPYIARAKELRSQLEVQMRGGDQSLLAQPKEND